MKRLNKILSIFLIITVMISIFIFPTQSASYTYNTGKRGVVCTSLSSKAKSYWSGNYAYSVLKTKSASTLRTTLRTKVNDFSPVGYNGLRTYMKYTDAYQGSKTKLMLFYSSVSTTSTWDSGKSWNREHIWPQSLGGNAVETDLNAMRPVDPTANSSRNNNKYGEVASGYTTFKTSSKNGSVICGYYKNSIFEPLDSVKGDVARIVLYDYVKTPNMKSVTEVFSSVSTLLNWNKQDPVDTYEMSRNDSVQSIQGNRNPFIDYPELGWLVLGYSVPSGIKTPSGQGNTSTTTTTTLKTFTKITSTSNLTSGTYVIVCGNRVFNANLSTLDSANNYITGTVSGNKIKVDAKYAFTITKSGSNYYLKANSGKYMGRSSNANGMNSSTSTSYVNKITFNSDGSVNIRGSEGAYLRFNSTSGQMRFRYYKTTTYTKYDAIYLYKLT